MEPTPYRLQVRDPEQRPALLQSGQVRVGGFTSPDPVLSDPERV